MGGCLSTQGKSRRRRHSKSAFSRTRRASRGSANYVIPVSQSSIDIANQKYVLGSNARREFADGGNGRAFLIERSISSLTPNGNSNGHNQFENHFGADDSRGSKDENFFDTDMAFNSDDEYMSVYGDFITSAGNSLSYPCNHAIASERPSLAELQVGMAQVEDWTGSTSRRMIGSKSPTGEEDQKCTSISGVPNGIAALTGATSEHLRVGKTSLGEQSLKKSVQMSAEDRMTPKRSQTERAASDPPGKRYHTSDNLSGRYSTASAGSGEPTKTTDHRGVFEGLCMPRLRSAVSSSKSRPISPRSFKKKGSLMRFSFKRHTSADLHDEPDTTSSKLCIERPLGGSQVPCCSSDKPLDGCWSEVMPSVFKLRGKHFSRDRKKSAAPDYALFVPVGVDLFMSSQKLEHIAQYVQLPFQDSLPGVDAIPGVFIVNIQLPLYPPSLFLGDSNGEGLSLVLYFKLSEEGMKRAPTHLKDMLRKFVRDDVERVKAFVGESHHPFRDRLKVIARLVNPEEVHISVAERKLLTNYNEKPVLSRPQHCFYKGTNYLEVDMDVHRFSFIARKGFETFRERLKLCVLDIGLTIQANKPEELPEQVMASVRLHKLNFGDFKILQAGSAAPSIISDNPSSLPSSP